MQARIHLYANEAEASGPRQKEGPEHFQFYIKYNSKKFKNN